VSADARDPAEVLETVRREARGYRACDLATATLHPSAVLPASDRRAEEYDGFVRDLCQIAADL
jgi:hypothetical protein